MTFRCMHMMYMPIFFLNNISLHLWCRDINYSYRTSTFLMEFENCSGILYQLALLLMCILSLQSKRHDCCFCSTRIFLLLEVVNTGPMLFIPQFEVQLTKLVISLRSKY